MTGNWSPKTRIYLLKCYYFYIMQIFQDMKEIPNIQWVPAEVMERTGRKGA